MAIKLPVYLDYNATTPMDPRVLDEMLPYFSEKFGNAASRTHAYGWEAEEAVDIAREQIATLIGAHPQEVVFTSGATEAVNLAIKGIIENEPAGEKHIITAATEHKAVLDTCKRVEKKGVKVTYLPVQSDGAINLEDLENAITAQTVLITLMYANNETGFVMPIKDISAIAKKHGVVFMTDASQAVGKIPVNVQSDGIDLMAFSAHKIYGPKGVGALYVRKKNPSVTLTSQIDGGGHERNMRSGTLNVPGIVGFGKACEICSEEINAERIRLSRLRDLFESKLLSIKDITINTADNEYRLPHATNISFHGIDGEKMIFETSSDLAFSRSSACTSATLEPSYVLKAMGLADDMIHNTFRFSFGRFSTEEEVEHAAGVISNIITQHRHERNYGHYKIV